MKIKVFCHGHNGARVRLLEGTTWYWYNDKLVKEASEQADTVELDEANLYCDGDVLKAEHKFGYYITV